MLIVPGPIGVDESIIIIVERHSLHVSRHIQTHAYRGLFNVQKGKKKFLNEIEESEKKVTKASKDTCIEQSAFLLLIQI